MSGTEMIATFHVPWIILCILSGIVSYIFVGLVMWKHLRELNWGLHSDRARASCVWPIAFPIIFLFNDEYAMRRETDAPWDRLVEAINIGGIVEAIDMGTENTPSPEPLLCDECRREITRGPHR